MREFRDKHILITGGTSGIGFAMAKILILQGAHLIIIGRNQDRLNKCEMSFRNESVKPIFFNLDLSKHEKRIFLYEDLKQKNIPVDILINNVAISFFGKFTDSNWEEIEQIIDTDLICLTHLCHLFIPDMIKRGEGAILNISSTASLLPCPNTAAYAATKAFVNSFSESLSVELKGTGIKVCYVIPGTTDTNFLKKGRMSNMEYIKKVKKMSPSFVAEKSLEALLRNKKGEIIGLRNKINMFITKCMPKPILREVSARVYRPVEVKSRQRENLK